MVSIPLLLLLFWENASSFNFVYDISPSSISSNTLPLFISLGCRGCCCCSLCWWRCCWCCCCCWLCCPCCSSPVLYNDLNCSCSSCMSICVGVLYPVYGTSTWFAAKTFLAWFYSILKDHVFFVIIFTLFFSFYCIIFGLRFKVSLFDCGWFNIVLEHSCSIETNDCEITSKVLPCLILCFNKFISVSLEAMSSRKTSLLGASYLTFGFKFSGSSFVSVFSCLRSKFISTPEWSENSFGWVIQHETHNGGPVGSVINNQLHVSHWMHGVYDHLDLSQCINDHCLLLDLWTDKTQSSVYLDRLPRDLVIHVVVCLQCLTADCLNLCTCHLLIYTLIHRTTTVKSPMKNHLPLFLYNSNPLSNS